MCVCQWQSMSRHRCRCQRAIFYIPRNQVWWLGLSKPTSTATLTVKGQKRFIYCGHSGKRGYRASLDLFNFLGYILWPPKFDNEDGFGELASSFLHEGSETQTLVDPRNRCLSLLGHLTSPESCSSKHIYNVVAFLWKATTCPGLRGKGKQIANELDSTSRREKKQSLFCHWGSAKKGMLVSALGSRAGLAG